MELLRAQLDEARSKNDQLRATVKHLGTQTLSQENEISLTLRNTQLESDVEKQEADLAEAERDNLEAAQGDFTSENLARKVKVLEEETETLEKQLREISESHFYH